MHRIVPSDRIVPSIDQQRLAAPSLTPNPLVYTTSRVLPTCFRHHIAVPAPWTSASGRQPPLTENCCLVPGHLYTVRYCVYQLSRASP